MSVLDGADGGYLTARSGDDDVGNSIPNPKLLAHQTIFLTRT